MNSSYHGKVFRDRVDSHNGSINSPKCIIRQRSIADMRKYHSLLHQFFQIGKKFRKSFFIQESGIKRFQVDMKDVFPRQSFNVGFIQSGELDPAFSEFLRCISFIPDSCHIQDLQRWCLQNQNQSDKQSADPKIPPDVSLPSWIKQRKKHTTRNTKQKINTPKEKPEFPKGKGRIHLKNSDIAKRLLRNIGTGY